MNDTDDLALALANARRMSSLMEQLRSLQEKPEDRLFYNGAQLRRRRELYRLTQQDLEDLRREEAVRLENALETTGSWTRPDGETPQIPQEEVARVERERDTLRREALEELAHLEKLRLETTRNVRLPDPAIADTQPLDAGDLSAETRSDRDELAVKFRTAAANAKRNNWKAGPTLDAFTLLQKERTELRERMLVETRAVTTRVARGRGYLITFARGKAPDRTSELSGDVRRSFAAGAATGGSK